MRPGIEVILRDARASLALLRMRIEARLEHG
jgi:hypothetical protein